MTVSPAVQHALDHVSEIHYTLEDDGSKLPQTSAPSTIATMLDMLDVQPGQRAKEVGTGSGFSTALLSHLVGEKGWVTSSDIDPALIRRARQRLRADGRANVTLRAADGATSDDGEQVDRVIAWATVERIPDGWVRRAAPGAVMVVPVQVTDLAKTFLVVRVHVGHGQALEVDELLQAGFVEATSHVLDQWIVPPRDVDALVHDGEGQPWWLSASWLRSGDGDTGRRLLQELQTSGRTVEGPLVAGEEPGDFYAFLLATRPEGLTTAALGDPVWRIGASTSAGIALITPRDADQQVAAGDDSASDLLAGWAQEWRDQGRPGLDQMTAELHHGDDGWTVRPTLAVGTPPIGASAL
ncbi:protein-L-isoaspartate O-methyltransferase [Nonomuraea sp. NPDC049646]|uniref:protein-L-isoaspartate O-methyltransferase family protein n=1 Tax=unclassified Nonomuraea TaxID=2593643 RepID=UPI0037AD5C0A